MSKTLVPAPPAKGVVWKSSALAPLGQVIGYRGFRAGAGRTGSRLVAPDGMVRIVFGFAGPVRIVSGLDPPRSVTATSLAIGVHATATLGEYTGPVHGVTVLLTPLAAHRLTAAPMEAFACRAVDLADVLGARVRTFAGRLAEYPDWHSRFTLLDRLLALRLLGAPPSSPQVDRAWRRLVHTAGRTPVRELAAETGWSHRQLERRFLQQVGLSPKSLAQVLRLQDALRHRRNGLTWADAAGAAGYYDQAHFTRSFKAMIGCTPGRFSALRADPQEYGPLDVLPDRVTTTAPDAPA
ncbi:AraC family transcriptional regulator [Streptomyces hygroscopicus]|uniref:helix-turn-helix domain-containing protein n=1 Tax=Streptomyces hygroscopicus TaxID=1912 RepID=UPI0033FDBD96